MSTKTKKAKDSAANKWGEVKNYVTLDITKGGAYYSEYTGARVEVINAKPLGVVSVALKTDSHAPVDFPQSQYKDLSHDPFLESEKQAIESIRNGADVYDYGLAWALRQVEKKMPEFITICPAMKAPKSGAKRQPYFGCIATAAGRTYLKSIGYEHGLD